MSYEMIAIMMFSSMMLMLMTGQRVFGVIVDHTKNPLARHQHQHH